MPQATFNFSVSSIDVIKPRSLINDTDYAVLSINALAADNTVITQYGPVTRSLGNLGDNTTIDPKLSLTGIAVPEGGSLAVSFVVINKGGWVTEAANIVTNALDTAGAAVLGALVQGQIVGPTTTQVNPNPAPGQPSTTKTTTTGVSLPEAIAYGALIIGALELISILFADCDGTVVPGTLSLGQPELLSNAVPGPWEITVGYPGTTSPVGCGPNSDYSVTYSVIGGVSWVTVPTVVGLSPKAADAALTAAGLTVEVIGYTAVKGAVSDEVMTQSPPAGSSVPISSVVQVEIGFPEGSIGGGGGGHLPP